MLMHNGIKHICVVFFLILLFSSNGYSQHAEHLSIPTPHWIEDKTGVMALDDVINADLSSEWNKAERHNLNFGFTDSVFWLSLPFENASSNEMSMLLELAFPLHDSIEVYLLDGKQVVRSYQTGDKQRFADRPLKHRHFLFPHETPAQTKLRAIVRVQTTDTMYLPVNVWETKSFISHDQHLSLLLGLFFGALLIMLVYNLFLYLSTGLKSYLNYVWCIGSIIFLQLTQKSVGFQYLWPDQPFFNQISVPLSSFLAMATSAYFLMCFLDLDKEHNPRSVHIFRIATWFPLLGIFFTISALHINSSPALYTLIVLSTAVIGSLATILIMATLISLALKGNQSAKILSIAWLSLLVGSLLFALGRMGAPMPMLLTENAMLIGSTFEAALISFALAMHIKKEREGRIRAQALALENERKTLEARNSLLRLQEEVTQQLEDEVKERTHKLQNAMQRLEDANHKLDNLSRLDALTGLSNRRDFDQTFNTQWHNHITSKQPISLLMADIDYFKKLNDNHGHLFGDQCLVKVATILKQCLTAPDYVAARFGGEEFIVLLPNTDAFLANNIAENIRRKIEALRLNNEGAEIRFTISIGIANMVPAVGTGNSELIACADEALYTAKDSGRNRVVGPKNGLISSQCQGSSLSITSAV